MNDFDSFLVGFGLGCMFSAFTIYFWVACR